jgi:hypothetical protein
VRGGGQIKGMYLHPSQLTLSQTGVGGGGQTKGMYLHPSQLTLSQTVPIQS